MLAVYCTCMSTSASATTVLRTLYLNSSLINYRHSCYVGNGNSRVGGVHHSTVLATEYFGSTKKFPSIPAKSRPFQGIRYVLPSRISGRHSIAGLTQWYRESPGPALCSSKRDKAAKPRPSGCHEDSRIVSSFLVTDQNPSSYPLSSSVENARVFAR